MGAALFPPLFLTPACSRLSPVSCNLRHYVNTWPATCHNEPRKLHGLGGTKDTGDRTWKCKPGIPTMVEHLQDSSGTEDSCRLERQ